MGACDACYGFIQSCDFSQECRISKNFGHSCFFYLFVKPFVQSVVNNVYVQSLKRCLSKTNEKCFINCTAESCFWFAAAPFQGFPQGHLLRAVAFCHGSPIESSYAFADRFCTVSVYAPKFGVMYEEKRSSICFHCSLSSFSYFVRKSFTSISLCVESHTLDFVEIYHKLQHTVYANTASGFCYTCCTDKVADKMAQGGVGIIGSRVPPQIL